MTDLNWSGYRWIVTVVLLLAGAGLGAIRGCRAEQVRATPSEVRVARDVDVIADEQHRQEIAEWLAGPRKPRVVPPAKSMVSSDVWLDRLSRGEMIRKALRHFSTVSDDRATPLAESLAHPGMRKSIRVLAIDVMARAPRRASIDLLVRLLSDSEPVVRLASAHWLHDLFPSAPMEADLGALDEKLAPLLHDRWENWVQSNVGLVEATIAKLRRGRELAPPMR